MMPPTGSLKINLPKDIAIVISWRRGPNTTFFVWRDNPLTGTMMGEEARAMDWIEATKLVGEMSGRAISEAMMANGLVAR